MCCFLISVKYGVGFPDVPQFDFDGCFISFLIWFISVVFASLPVFAVYLIVWSVTFLSFVQDLDFVLLRFFATRGSVLVPCCERKKIGSEYCLKNLFQRIRWNSREKRIVILLIAALIFSAGDYSAPIFFLLRRTFFRFTILPLFRHFA